MNRLLMIIAILISASIAIASPFIVADPDPTVTQYQIRLSSDGGTTWGNWVQGNPVANTMRFDIGTTPAGNYKGEVQAGANVTLTDSTTGQTSTVFKWSASAPFLLVVPTGKTVTHITVTTQ